MEDQDKNQQMISSDEEKKDEIIMDNDFIPSDDLALSAAAEFSYQKRSMNEDGTSNLDEMKVDVPMLAIVPIPNLQIDEVNILFDMEVKQSERSEESMDIGASVFGGVKCGIAKAKVTGNVSTHGSNTRSSDNSAKYHVDVRATNHGTPEGLARVLDMMAANAAPALVDSTRKDGNGQNLTEQARIKAVNLKAIRQDISTLENRLSAVQDGMNMNLAQLKKVGSAQCNAYQAIIIGLRSECDPDKFDEKIKNAKDDEEREKFKKEKENSEKQLLEYNKTMDEVNQSWNNFMNQAGDIIKMIVDSKKIPDRVSEMFALKAVSSEGKIIPYDDGQEYYSELLTAQNQAIDSQKNINKMEKDLLDKKAQYSDAVAGRTRAGLPDTNNENNEQNSGSNEENEENGGEQS